MFDAVRNNKRIVQIFLALITLPFALWGVDSYVRNADSGNDVATVGESKITLQQFHYSWRDQLEQARRQLGPKFRQEQFDTPDMRMMVLNNLIDQRLLLLEANKGRLGVSDAFLAEMIAGMPSVQVDGKFSRARYESLIAAQGMSVQEFESRLRQDLSMQQLVGPVADSGIVPVTTAEMMLRIQSEERQVAEVRLPPEQFAGDVKIDAEAIKQYYEANQKQFQTPELVKAEYVVLSIDGLLSQVAVSDAEVRQYFDAHLDKYQEAEQRRASHILITLPSGASPGDRDKAKSKAEEILKEVQKTPAKFAELAKKHSQDPGSASVGGDLGFFGRGMMVKPFEEAVFKQKQGELSGLVQSDFGFHIIKLTGIKEARQKKLDEVRAEIEGELKRQGAQRRFAEAAEAFKDMVYEQSDSLQPVVDKFKLKVQQSPLLPKSVPQQALASLGPLGNERLIAALFSEDAIRNKRNTEAVDVGQNMLVSARVIEHRAASVRPLESVRNDIEAILTANETAKLAKQRGEERLAELRAGKDDVKWALVKSVSRLQGKAVPPAAMQAIFSADVGKLPAYAGVVLPNNGGYALYKIMAVKQLEKADEDRRRVLQRDYTGIVAQEEFAAYLAGLRQRYKVAINKVALERDR